MSRKFWVIIILTIALLISIIMGMIYVVYAKYTYNDFIRSLTIPFNAATYINAHETHTDPDQAILVTNGGETWILHPDQYKKVLVYLKYNAVYVPFGHVPDNAALKLVICNETEILVQPDPDGQTAMIRLSIPNRTFTMRISCSGLYEKLLNYCQKDAIRIE